MTQKTYNRFHFDLPFHFTLTQEGIVLPHSKNNLNVLI
jgi:hypothetical protein